MALKKQDVPKELIQKVQKMYMNKERIGVIVDSTPLSKYQVYSIIHGIWKIPDSYNVKGFVPKTMKRAKFTPEMKVNLTKDIESGVHTTKELSVKYNTTPSRINYYITKNLIKKGKKTGNKKIDQKIKEEQARQKIQLSNEQKKHLDKLISRC